MHPEKTGRVCRINSLNTKVYDDFYGGIVMKAKKAKHMHEKPSPMNAVKILEERLTEVDDLPEPRRSQVIAWFERLKNHAPVQLTGTDSKELMPDPDFPGGPVAWLATLSDIAGTTNSELAFVLLNEVFNSTGTCGLGPILATMMGIAPKDEVEAMLATQMIALHYQAMRMMQRTVVEGQSVAGVNYNINRSDKLLRAFRETLAALQKYRGKGVQQKVTVEHVHVHQGGQAVVGVISQTGGKGDMNENRQTTTSTRMLESGKHSTALEFQKGEAVWCEDTQEGDPLYDASDEKRSL
jgi:hypothetical protein